MDITYIIIIIIFLVFITAGSALKNRAYRSEIKFIKTETEQLKISLAKAEEKISNIHAEKESMVLMLQQEQKRLITELQTERQNLADINLSYESSRTYLKVQNEKIKEQKEEIEKLHEKLNKDFELLAGRILEEKSQKFTELNRANLDLLLHPLKENIKAFENKVDKVYQTEAAERNILKGEISKLMELNKQISDEANNLTKALKADSKKQGNWGEVVLDRILEASGLIQNESYIKQSSFTDENGNRLQPDVVVTLPDKKHLIIDSKVSLIAYNKLVNCETEIERIQYLNDHITSIRSHIKNLCSKNYCDLYSINSPDFVLLFVPIESSFAIAVQHDIELFEFAWNKRVVIVTPSTLLATLKTISSVWKQEQQTRNAIDIATRAGALYDKFAGFLDDLKKIGDNLDKAKDAYSDAFNKLSSGNGNLIGRVETLKKLGAKTSKQISNEI
ncbi:DNA recombination protein RmuC [Arcticibacter tournemirensis]